MSYRLSSPRCLQDTNVHVSGIVGQEAVVFRSAMAPLRLTLRISQASGMGFEDQGGSLVLW